ncbi:MAG: hypothetical protein FJ303_12055 [Planctomycetes bacterium]|nr:hypothetical protein [Planctomycetota bacterium]
METIELTLPSQATSPATPRCPACGAALMPLRGDYRCVRCLLLVCASCEPDVLDDVEVIE